MTTTNKQTQTNNVPRQPANQELRWLELKDLSPLEFSKFEEKKMKKTSTYTATKIKHKSNKTSFSFISVICALFFIFQCYLWYRFVHITPSNKTRCWLTALPFTDFNWDAFSESFFLTRFCKIFLLIFYGNWPTGEPMTDPGWICSENALLVICDWYFEYDRLAGLWLMFWIWLTGRPVTDPGWSCFEYDLLVSLWLRFSIWLTGKPVTDILSMTYW